MKLTKQQVSDILDIVYEAIQKTKEVQDTFKNFIKLIADNEYPPYVDWNRIETTLSVIWIVDKDLKENIEYFLYEAPGFWRRQQSCLITEKDLIQYSINNIEEAKEYILKDYD